MKTALTNSLVVLCLMIAVSDRARSQSTTEAGGLTAEQILEKNIAAIGGREKIEKSSSL